MKGANVFQLNARYCFNMIILSKTILLSLASLATVGAASDTNKQEKRGIFGPISTTVPNLAGGNAACDAAPISSFFTGMKPPVSLPCFPVGHSSNTTSVPNKHLVGTIRYRSR